MSIITAQSDDADDSLPIDDNDIEQVSGGVTQPWEPPPFFPDDTPIIFVDR